MAKTKVYWMRRDIAEVFIRWKKVWDIFLEDSKSLAEKVWEGQLFIDSD
jgi:hypothetical protein